jgi:cytochrome c peroxidase
MLSAAMMAGPGAVRGRIGDGGYPVARQLTGRTTSLVATRGGRVMTRPYQGHIRHHAGDITRQASDSVPAAQRVFESQLDTLLASFDTLAHRVELGQSLGAQHAFRRARTAYKRAEGMLGYYAPDAITALEGPLEAAGEDDILPRPYSTPGAFPMIESLIFPRLADSVRATALARIHAIRERVAVLRSATDVLDVEDVAVFDAARAELARVSTLDLAGFDSDRQDDALLDAAAALDGVRATLVAPDEPESAEAADRRRQADSALRLAAGYLRQHPVFERMDRFTFVARYSLPASHAVAALRAARGVANTRGIHLWREEAASVYDSAAFDPLAYAARYAYTPSPGERIVALGARLFADPRLSGPGTRSCATCHLPGRAFTDGLPKRASLAVAVAAAAPAPPARHTPTLLNAALQPALFDDERARTPELQIAQVLSNAEEMGSSTDTAVYRVAADSGYRAAFASAFGGSPDRAVTGITLRLAIASYVRSLIALNSPFDRAVRGDSAVLSVAARRGFTVFMGKARCGTCHFAPLFNGTEPPSYVTTDPEIIGVPERPVLRHARLDPDPGREAIDRVPSHRFAFKVPTVRNAAVTGPYMHNGAYRTLDDIVAFYDAGGGAGIGLDLPYQTLFDHPLKLTRGERADLIAFLRSLTDTSVSAVSPSRVASR